MNWKNIIISIMVLVILLLFVMPFFAGPVIGKKITKALNAIDKHYQFEIDKVHLSLIPSKLEIEKITISSIAEQGDISELTGEIAMVQFKGIKLLKVLFKNEYDLEEVLISNSRFKGKVAFQVKKKLPKIAHFNLHIGKVTFDQINIRLKDTASSQALSVKEGSLKLFDLKIEKLDTLGSLPPFDFKTQEFISVSADSLYTYKANEIVYSDSLKTLSMANFHIQPNYKNYDFTARYEKETDRIEAFLTDINLSHFYARDYWNSGNLIISYLEIGKMELDAFRDKRKEDNLDKKPEFQELVYNFPGFLRIDSIGLNSGSITYTEHAEKANSPGVVKMNGLKATIYNITNDTIYKSKNGSMEMIAEAMLMEKSKMTFAIKAKLYDSLNTFTANGTLSEMAVKDLNPILVKNAFVYANSAKINKINYSFTANNSKATGKMIMLYTGLDVAVKNKKTDDTTAIKEQIVSFFANQKVFNSNPLPGEKVRTGIIDYQRDPSKFLFHYCFRSIMSGIKSSVIDTHNSQKGKRTLLQKLFGKPHDKVK